MELGQPLPVWRWAVVSGETRLLNSNSKTGVQDPRHTWIQNIEKISFQLKFVHQRFLIRFFCQIPIGGVSWDYGMFMELYFST